ncbi:MAG: efflux RND transporter periplasmic adaptor subunit [FCB group bacterium]|nr:efflux RND transporter periplasmic adaptor subunit [FCB group bacterium]
MNRRTILVLITLFVINGCGNRQNDAENKLKEVPVPVKVEPIVPKPFRVTYHTLGKTESVRQVNLFFEATGQVDSIFVDENDFVRKDQPLAKIRQEQYRANFIRARSAYEKAKKDLENADDLFRKNIISKDQRDQARLGYDNAHANFIQAKTALENTILSAPFSGRIIQRNVEVGDVIAPGAVTKPAFVIADMRKLKVVVSVPESEISKIREGQEVELEFKTFPERTFKGSVSRVSLATRSLSNTFDVEILIDNPNERLRLGLIADVNIILEKYERAMVLPIRLIHEEKDRQYVFLADGNRAKRVDIRILNISGSQVLVEGALSPGDSLITDGHHDVKDGTLILKVEESSTAS